MEILHLTLVITIIAAIVIFALFTFVIAFGAPFLPTLRKQVSNAMDVLDLKPGQTLLELGSGDGRILLAAAKQGANAVGYELNPLLVIYSRLVTFKYRKQIKIVWGNYWHKKWPATDTIFVFLLNPYMEKLNNRIVQEYKKPIRLVSFAFNIPSKKPDLEKNGMYLYTYNKSK
jgi:16S rRNA A1518/A1519 N6-dimethyltransferase RsmA/KsgA/DIM1 with predicted DNA glycosylase/AP lyase activity